MEPSIGTEFACALPGGFRLLLAEDDRLSAGMVTDTLIAAGFGVHHVTDGLNALEAIEREHVDLLITDWVMPRLNGLDLVEAIRERPHLNDLYVIFLSAIDDKEQLVRALSAGADDYLAKPFHSGELLARVRAGTRILGLQRELATANRTLQRLAMTDALTELPNRRALHEMVATETARIARGGPDSCLAMIDLDNFKQANDAYGHRVGDEVLTHIARTLRVAARAADTVGRLGGDEFVVILHGCAPAEALDACQRIRSHIVGNPALVGPDARPLDITASFGIALLKPHMRPEEALASADLALYDAKNAGRNTVVAA